MLCMIYKWFRLIIYVSLLIIILFLGDDVDFYGEWDELEIVVFEKKELLLSDCVWWI